MDETYDFDEQLNIGRKYEYTLDGALLSCTYVKGIERVSLSEERKGIDRYVTMSDGRRLAVQYKADKTAGKTGNAFIETISVDNDETEEAAGWAFTCEADYIFYFVVDNREIYVIQPRRLRRKLPFWQRRFPSRTVPNGRYKTVGLLVPLQEIARISKSVLHLHEEPEGGARE